ncbi:MAG TPA: hypothetical protein DC013_07985, partial [Ruminococcaceae bacterium]|nr:hypothetical protein [Oscillospiraceae bacterium]
GVKFTEIASSLRQSDPYMVLADYDDYARAQKESAEIYRDRKRWSQMGLVNIADAGRFAADRAIREYADDIWDAKPVSEERPAKFFTGKTPFGKNG